MPHHDTDLAAVLEELRAHIDRPPILDLPREWKVGDFEEHFELKRSAAERAIADLVSSGIICGGDAKRDLRIDPRTGKRVTAYWCANGGGLGGAADL